MKMQTPPHRTPFGRATDVAVGVKWLRRTVAFNKQRLLSLLRRISIRQLSAAEARRRLIEAGRRDPALRVPVSIKELTGLPCGSRPIGPRPRLVILQLAHIGDFIVSLRAVKTIRRGFPQADITFVCGSWSVDWAIGIGLFDRVVAFDFFTRLNANWTGPTNELFDRFESLGLGAFDVAVDLRHDADTRPCLYRIDAHVRAGFFAPPQPGRPPLDLMLPSVELIPFGDGREYSLHATLRLDLLASLVVSAFADDGPHPLAAMAGATSASKRPPFAILSVSAGDAIRRWPTDKFVDLGRRLIENYGVDLLIVGGGAESALVQEIVDALPTGRAFSRIDLSLIDLTVEVGRSSLLIGLGSGVTHLAASLGVPTITLLSGVSPVDVWRPVGPRVVNLVGATPCSPCNLKNESECPFDVVCLREIPPERVLAVVGQVWRRPETLGAVRCWAEY
jgi:ADP-heptose:LPS heptosyltransferase